MGGADRLPRRLPSPSRRAYAVLDPRLPDRPADFGRAGVSPVERSGTVKAVGVIVVLVMLGFAYQSFHQDTASGVQCPARSSAPSR